MLFFVACISCITVACDSDDDGTKGDDNKFPAPEVTFSAITGVSFTAGWNALETADSYRYEVSYEKDGQVVAVAAQNTETTTFSLDGFCLLRIIRSEWLQRPEERPFRIGFPEL